MDQKCDRVYPSVPLEKDDLELRLEKKASIVLLTSSTTLKKKSHTSKIKTVYQKRDTKNIKL